jgi:beta-galactosidase
LVRNFDQAWRFSLPDNQARPVAAAPGSKDLVPANDSAWEQVNLPHSVRLEPLNASGGRNYQGICWYQKRFAVLPEWRGRIVQLVFQGAMQVADVWMNGNHLTTHYDGYLPFVVDISAHAQLAMGTY